jgi:uncharacterized membrane protein
MDDKKETSADGGVIARMLAVVEKEKTRAAPRIANRNTAGASTAPSVMKHIASGAGAATARSGKGGKSGGGMGGRKAGGMVGGGKRKTHAGRK